MIPSARARGRRRCWFHASSVTKYVTVRSKPGWFEGHWVERGQRSVRCEGAGCPICASGARAQLFVYVFLEVETGEVLVWQIPTRLDELAREIEASLYGGPGVQLAISREGLQKNSRIVALVVGFEPCEELDIEPFVATLGFPKSREARPKQASSTP